LAEADEAIAGWMEEVVREGYSKACRAGVGFVNAAADSDSGRRKESRLRARNEQ
jgi:hypothetical protein